MKERENNISLSSLEGSMKRDIERLKMLNVPLMSQKLMYGTIWKNMKIPFFLCFGIPFLIFITQLFLFSSFLIESDFCFFLVFLGFNAFAFYLLGYVIFDSANMISMFQIAVRDKLETGYYFEQKALKLAKQAIKTYLLFFFTVYSSMIFFWLEAGMIFVFVPVLVATILTLIIFGFYIRMEMQRLGITVLSNEISNFFKKKGLISSENNVGSKLNRDIASFQNKFGFDD